MQGILLLIRYFEREFIKSYSKDNFIFLSNRMSQVCHSYILVCDSYIIVCHSYVVCKYSYVICISPMSFVCHRHVIHMSLACHPYVTCMYSYVIRLAYHPCVTRMWFYHEPFFLVHSKTTDERQTGDIRVLTRMSLVCHSYVLLCHSYDTPKSSVCHSYILAYHPYVTGMWFYHEPFFLP